MKKVIPWLVAIALLLLMIALALPNFVKAGGPRIERSTPPKDIVRDTLRYGDDSKTPENLAMNLESPGERRGGPPRGSAGSASSMGADVKTYERGSPSTPPSGAGKLQTHREWTWYDPGTDDDRRWVESPKKEPYDLMFFQNYGVNPFIPTEYERFSTFAMDVDTASYTIARRYLNDGNIPDRDAVRTEEFINYFDLEYPDTDDTFSIHIEGAESEFGRPDYHLLQIGIKANDAKWRRSKPANIVFVIDVSGSMSRENRLEMVKRSIRKLSQNFYQGDQVALVTFNTSGRVVCDLTWDKNRIYKAIDELYPQGNTNVYQGLVHAYNIAEKNFNQNKINKIILCSDGVANTQISNPDQLIDFVIAESRKGISLSTIGFGMGNYNDVLMEKLADNGDGSYYYVDTDKEANRLFDNGAEALLGLLVTDAKIQVEFNSNVVEKYRLIGYENRKLNKEDFRNDYVDAGEVSPGQSVTALYEIEFNDDVHRIPGADAAIVRIRYRDSQTEKVREQAKGVRVADVRRKFDSASPQFKFTACVAEFAEVLKKSYWADDAGYDHILSVAERTIASYPKLHEEQEFVGLVRRAKEIDTRQIAKRWQ